MVVHPVRGLGVLLPALKGEMAGGWQQGLP